METKYKLHEDGVTGYKFPPLPEPIMSMYQGEETEIAPGTEEMGRANDALRFGEDIDEKTYLEL
jgi:hypothetical protein